MSLTVTRSSRGGVKEERKEEAFMEGAEFSHQVRRTAVMTLALVAGLVFGIVLLATSDWIPGAIIVAVTVVGLARQVPVIRELCSTDWPPSPPKSKPAS